MHTTPRPGTHRRLKRGRITAGLTAALLIGPLGLPAAHAVTAPAGQHPRYASGQPAPQPRSGGNTSNLLPLSDGYGATAAQDSAMASAAARATGSGKAAVVDALTTPVQQVTANPRGGFELTSSPEPVRTRRHGSWVPVSLTLRQGADGSWSPAATAYGTVAFSPGGSGPLVTTRSGGTTLALSWPGRLPKPVVDGSTATYRSVLPSVDLVMTATATGGFSDTLVVHDAKAAANPAVRDLRLTTHVSGGRLDSTGNGALSVVDQRGRDLLDAASPLMWDSNTRLTAPKGASRSAVAADASDPGHPGLAARIAPVGAEVSGNALSLKPSGSLLASRSTAYPVYIDPTFNWHPDDPAAPAFDEVKQGCSSTSFYDKSSDAADDGYLGVGYNGWIEGDCDTGDEHALYQWNLPSLLWGAHVNSATVKATEVYSASCGAGSYTVNLHWSKGIGSGTDWNNRPGYNSYSTSADFARAYNPTYCSGNGSVSEGFNVLTPVKDDAAGHSSSFTATLSEDSAESRHDDGGFSRFAHNPSLDVMFNRVPTTPTPATMTAVSGADNAACDTSAPYPYMGKTIASTPPVLKAKVSDPDGDKLQATFQYWVDGSSTKATGVSGDNLASGSYAAYSLPASFISSLTSGQVVDWQAKVTDGEDTSAYSSVCHFTAEPTAPDTPGVSSKDGLYPQTNNGADGTKGAAAGTSGQFTLTAGSGTSVSKFVYRLDTPPATSNPPASEVVAASGNTATVSIAPPSPGPHTLWVYSVDAAGDIDVSGAYGYGFVAANHAAKPCASLAACLDNTAISPDTNTSAGDADGSNSFSAGDLTTSGWNSGGKVTIDGATFSLPAYGSGQKDNVLAANQTITYSGSGNALMFLATSTHATAQDPGAISGDATAPYVPQGTAVTGSYCFSGTDTGQACPATGLITYTDGTTASYDLTVPDWIAGPYTLAGADLPHWNTPSGQSTDTSKQPKIYPFAVPIDPSKTIASVTLPDVSQSADNNTPALHIFGMATRDTTTGTPKADGSVAAAPSGQQWTGAWTSPSEGQYNLNGSGFGNQTFRVAVKPSVSGNTVRIKLDNALGLNKLSIGHVTMATDSSTSEFHVNGTPTSTPTTLSFGGSTSVTIPAGGMVYSDPLSYAVPQNRFVLVSFYLSNSVPALVQHSYANSTYQLITAAEAGDKTMDTTLTPFTGTGTTDGWFSDLLTDLDVSTSNVPTQAVLGDGLVDAVQPNAKPDANGYRVPDIMDDTVPTSPDSFSTISEGVEGNQLMADYPEKNSAGGYVGGPAALSRIDRDILDQPGLSSVVISEGLEDLLGGLDEDDLEANGYTALVQQLQGWGISATLTSMTPCDGYQGDGATVNDPCTSSVDSSRTDVNAWLGAGNLGNPWSTPAVYFADFDAALAVPDTANGEEQLNSQGDNGDHANLNTTGYAAETSTILSPHDTWELDDGDGLTTASDTAPTDTSYSVGDPTVGANPLTLNGTVTWTDDPTQGEVPTFDGSTTYAAAAGPVLDTSQSYSISAWAKLSSLPTSDATVVAQAGNQQSAFYLVCDKTGWAFSLSSSDAASTSFSNAYSAGITTNTWTHLVGVYNAQAKTAQLYVNGTLTATVSNVSSWKAAGLFTVGRDRSNGSDTHYFPGMISDVQTWNYALDSFQAFALYKNLQ
ncbi:LamG-like jellyroll fold domain-containing protein [Streptantibioticus parmotrematis]|uniref:LamG-like jellyroll fold domain-containing protein n=1 Tax=Streptantibioticus parmotrematis TaxID=2873249 RepID=UPI0033EB7DDD